MSQKHVIGIIGGMGPAAGVDLLVKLIQLTRAGSDHDHLPVLLYSLPRDIPDRTPFLLTGEGPNPGDAIAEIALGLESAGATIAGIPCNTAHAPAIMDSVMSRLARAGSKLRVVNMIAETVCNLRENLAQKSRVGVLSTTGTRRSRIYSEPLGLAGFEVLELDDASQERLVTASIYSADHGLKIVSPPSPQAREQLIQAIENLARSGADCIVLGCTELPLAVPERHWDGLPLVDPAEILARALIRETYPDRLIAD